MDGQEWYTVQEAAEFLRVDRTTIYRWAREGELAYHELPRGAGRRFHRNDLESVLRRVQDPSEETKRQ